MSIDEQKLIYEEYLDFMQNYEEKNGYYPNHISNGQWTPYSFSEWQEKTKNGTLKIY